MASEDPPPRRPTRPGDAPPPETPPPAPGQLRGSVGEFVVVALLTGGLLFGVLKVGLIVYFKTAGLRPGIRFLSQEIGGQGAVLAKARLGQIVDANFRFPILLELGDATYFLYRGDHFQFTVDTPALLRQAAGLEADLELWDRAEMHATGAFPVVDLPWKPTLDREYSAPRVAKLIEDRADSRTHAFPQPDGTVRLVVSDTEDQVRAVLDALERELLRPPGAARRVISVGEMTGNQDERVIAPDDPEQGFKASLAAVDVALEPADRVAAHNVNLAASKLHGAILNPGQELDVGAFLGPFSAAGGYRTVKVAFEPPVDPRRPAGLTRTTIMRDDPKAYGHGVERLATATFRALLRAGADQVARTTHRHFPEELGYTPLGLDVQLLPTEDRPPGRLVMRNRWDFPLRILVGLAPDRVQVEVTGLQEPPRSVEIRVGVPEKVPYKTELVRDPALARGVEQVDVEGIDGYTVKLFRKLTRPDGVETLEKMIGDAPVEYEARPSRILLGTGSPVREVMPPPEWGGY